MCARFKKLVKKLKQIEVFETYINQLLIPVELPIQEFEEKSLRERWSWCYQWNPWPSVSPRNCPGDKEGPTLVQFPSMCLPLGKTCILRTF